MPHHDDPTEVQGIPHASSPQLRVIGMWNGGHVVRDLPSSGSLVLGRSEEADLVLDHPSVSRKHATLLFDDGLRVQDHGSSNGTWIDGRKLEPGTAAPIQPGSVIELGAVMLVVRGQLERRGEPSASASKSAPLDPPMQEVLELVEVVAQSRLTVVLVGETGVGKEVLAARIHSASPRADKPFVKLNCAALVENLLESELFGHERGAFTGATQPKEGLAEAAHGGTLFLDEVGELSLSTQAKLLRLLESGEITRVGGLKTIPIDVRFVCATNRDLKEMVQAGRFREDLYFRLDGLTIQVPPLRERPSEIETLARQFLEESAASAGKPAPVLGADAVARLARHNWPGNVRELRNVIARSALFCRGETLGAADLRMEVDGTRPSAPPSADALGEKRRKVMEALEQAMWNQTRAAASLGISRRTLHNWLVELGIPRARGKVKE
jgi:two-component system, NtrC family, response regulator AtoC